MDKNEINFSEYIEEIACIDLKQMTTENRILFLKILSKIFFFNLKEFATQRFLIMKIKKNRNVKLY